MKNTFLKFFLALSFFSIFSFALKNHLLKPNSVFSQGFLVTNGDFEQGETGWFFEAPNGPIEKQTVEEPGYLSSKALHIKNLDQNKRSRVIQWVTINNGQHYKLSLVLKKSNEDNNQPTIKADEWCLSNNNNSSSSNRFIKGQSFVIQLPNRWEEKEWFFQAGNCDTNQDHRLAIFFDTGLYQNNPRIGEIWVDNVFLQVTQSPDCPKKTQGDANCDGNINENDYNIWRCEFLGNGTCSNPSSQKTADFNLDTKVDLVDFEIWRQNRFAPTPTNNLIPTLTPTINPIPTTISIPTPTNTPLPTLTPTSIPQLSDLVVLNPGLGISCNQLCFLARETCRGVGTDPNGTNNRMAVFRNNRCTILYNISSCGVNLMNNGFTSCSDLDGNNSDKNPYPADWTYCRCSNSHASISCTSNSQCPEEKVCLGGKCVIPSCRNVGSCQDVNFSNHQCNVLNKPDGSECLTGSLIIGQCQAGQCVPPPECEFCGRRGYCPDFCLRTY